MLKILGAVLAFYAGQLAADTFQLYSPARGHATAAAAVLHLKVNGGLNCSGVYIGPRGEALTNLHCVEKCLLDNGAVTAEAHGLIQINRVHLPQPITCQATEVLIDGKIQKVDMQIRHVFGPGFLSPRDALDTFQKQAPADFTALLQAGFEGTGDLVLIQVPGASHCVPLAKGDLARTTEAFNLGYPIVWRKLGEAYDADWLISLGTSLLYTQGVITTSAQTIAEQFNPADRAYVQLNMGPGTFLSTLDCDGGSSGSPVFAGGGLVGILRSTFKPVFSAYRPWTTEGIDLNPDADVIRELVPLNAECPLVE